MGKGLGKGAAGKGVRKGGLQSRVLEDWGWGRKSGKGVGAGGGVGGTKLQGGGCRPV